MHKKTIIILFLTLLIFGACSKTPEEFNKPAAYWYDKLLKSVGSGDLEKADNYYSSLQSEHIGSPLLPQATMILATAHMYFDEYLLSEHFLNEYIRRYATPVEKEYAEYLKIKAKYMALPNPRRDQGLIASAIEAGESYKLNYPSSSYYPVVDTMVTRLYMAQASLNDSIALLYDRVDKPKGAEFYRNIQPEPWINWDEVEKAKAPLYRSMFEGDGTGSWYGFIIPDTQSVISRTSKTDNGLQEPRGIKSQEQDAAPFKEPARPL